jgi:hypothetical protein
MLKRKLVAAVVAGLALVGVSPVMAGMQDQAPAKKVQQVPAKKIQQVKPPVGKKDQVQTPVQGKGKPVQPFAKGKLPGQTKKLGGPGMPSGPMAGPGARPGPGSQPAPFPMP